MPVSGDTLLRLIQAVAIPVTPSPTIRVRSSHRGLSF
jgi:hypothetical protein